MLVWLMITGGGDFIMSKEENKTLESYVQDIAQLVEKANGNCVLFVADTKNNCSLFSDELENLVPCAINSMRQNGNLLAFMSECVIRLMLDNEDYADMVLYNFKSRKDGFSEQ